MQLRIKQRQVIGRDKFSRVSIWAQKPYLRGQHLTSIRQIQACFCRLTGLKWIPIGYIANRHALAGEIRLGVRFSSSYLATSEAAGRSGQQLEDGRVRKSDRQADQKMLENQHHRSWCTEAEPVLINQPFQEVAPALSLSFLKRMPSQPHEMFSAALWNAYCRFQGMKKWWSDLESFQVISPAAARAELAKRLLAQISYFGTRDDALPEWREAGKVRNPDELWRVWPDLPIVSKQDLQNSFRPHEIKRRFGIKGNITSTGGSTGEPTWFLHDTDMQQASKATNVYCRLKVGWRPGLPTIIVWGSERDIGKQQALRRRVLMRLANLLLIDAYELTSATVDKILELIRKYPGRRNVRV